MLSYVIRHRLTADEITIGSHDCTVYLNGISILERHAVIRRIAANQFELTPAEAAAKIKVNGFNISRCVERLRCELTESSFRSATPLQHRDRILFGANHLYVFVSPADDTKGASTHITWDFAQKELAQAKGYSFGTNVNMEQSVIQEKILNLLPLLSEVNAISEELNKYRVFEIILMPISSWDGISTKGSR